MIGCDEQTSASQSLLLPLPALFARGGRCVQAGTHVNNALELGELIIKVLSGSFRCVGLDPVLFE